MRALALLAALALAGCSQLPAAAEVPTADQPSTQAGLCSLSISGSGGAQGASFLQGNECYLPDILDMAAPVNLTAAAEWDALQPTAGPRLVLALEDARCQQVHTCVIAERGGVQSPVTIEASAEQVAGVPPASLVLRVHVDGLMVQQPMKVKASSRATSTTAADDLPIVVGMNAQSSQWHESPTFLGAAQEGRR